MCPERTPTAWLGREDSNLRMAESTSAALLSIPENSANARGPVTRWAQGVGRWVQVAATAPRSNMAYPGQQSEGIQSDRLQPTCSVANQRETLRNAARECWNPVPLPPPVITYLILHILLSFQEAYFLVNLRGLPVSCSN